MFRDTALALALPALLLATPASAQQAGPTPGPRSGEETSIPFITHGEIRTFTPTDNGDGVYIQNTRRDWYYVTFFSRCTELPFASAIGFTTFAGGPTLERNDTILVGRDRCTIASIVHSGPPPEKPKKPKKPKA